MPAAPVRSWLTPDHAMELPALLPAGACDLGTIATHCNLPGGLCPPGCGSSNLSGRWSFWRPHLQLHGWAGSSSRRQAARQVAGQHIAKGA